MLFLTKRFSLPAIIHTWYQAFSSRPLWQLPASLKLNPEAKPLLATAEQIRTSPTSTLAEKNRAIFDMVTATENRIILHAAYRNDYYHRAQTALLQHAAIPIKSVRS